jgi:hypothetical protein
MGTTVVHCKRDVYDEYVGRPSKWGNPFVIGIDGDRIEVVAKYRLAVLNAPKMLAALPELYGRRLGCHCVPALCHGHVLADLADIPVGPALWRSSAHDLPVDITGVMGVSKAGVIYLKTTEGTGLPVTELLFPAGGQHVPWRSRLPASVLDYQTSIEPQPAGGP